MARGRYVGKGALLGYGPKVQVQTVTSTATILNNWGIVEFGSTAAAKTWRMKDPEPGQTVTLRCSAAAGQRVQTVKTSSTRNFVGPNGTLTQLRFTGTDQAITLLGRTTANFQIVGRVMNTVVDAASTATHFPTNGIVSFGATGAESWRMAQPQPGDEVVLYCDDAATGAIQKVFASTNSTAPAVQFVSTGGSKLVAQFNKDGEILFMKALSTAKWLVSPNASIAYSTA
jgi:hypothetical protein